MSFLFNDPIIPDPGLVHSGYRGTGGLAIAPDGKFVPHYNLAAITNRSFVTELGFIEGLIPPSLPERTWFKHPGHFRGDRKLNQLREHNLLATHKADDELVIWMINESSDQTMVEEFRTQATMEDNDWALSRDVRVSHTYSNEDPVEQLRSCNIPNKALWMRHKRKLSCLSSSFEESFTVFQSSIKTFEEHRYLEGEVYILDISGMLWSGEVGHSLGRTKNGVGDCLNLVTQSEHPRVVFGADEFQIRTVDIREDTTATSQLLFEVPKNEHRVFYEDEYIQTPIVHMKTIPNKEHYILALNDRYLYLIDERFPRSVLLTQNHSIPQGGHVFLCAEPVNDSPNGDRAIHNQFFLDHGATGVWISSIYEQPSKLFSSIRPVHQLREPKDAFSVLAPPKQASPYQADSPPRAISVVQGFKDKNNRNIDVLVRALDDGAVLYSKLLYGEVGLKENQNSFKQSRRRFMDWVNDAADEMESWGRYYKSADRENVCTTICVQHDVPEMDETWDATDSHPLNFQPVDTGCHLKTLIPPNSNAIISSSILSLWNSLR